MKVMRYWYIRITVAAIFFALIAVNAFTELLPSAYMLVIFAALAATASVFGRYFCAVCPFGILQELICAFRKRNRTRTPNLKYLRYCIAFFTFLFLAAGWAVGLRFFDPFTRFGGIIFGLVSFEAIGLLTLVVLTVLVLWKKRIYCTAVCPLGTVLGLCAKHALYQLRMNENCTSCGSCEAKCPVSCIDSRSRVIDNERCVRCMNCISLCTRKGISQFSRSAAPADYGRRNFLIAASSGALGALVAGNVFGGTIRALVRGSNSDTILPPGAGDRETFLRKCTSCKLCALSCPSGIIKSRPLAPVHLDYSHNGCLYDCVRCSAVCPFGALQTLTLEDKQWLKIGEAVLDAPKCRIVKDNTACDLCAKACPKGAIYMTNVHAGNLPEVNPFHCIGCGVCQAACPVQAITVKAAEQRV